MSYILHGPTVGYHSARICIHASINREECGRDNHPSVG